MLFAYSVRPPDDPRALFSVNRSVISCITCELISWIICSYRVSVLTSQGGGEGGGKYAFMQMKLRANINHVATGHFCDMGISRTLQVELSS